MKARVVLKKKGVSMGAEKLRMLRVLDCGCRNTMRAVYYSLPTESSGPGARPSQNTTALVIQLMYQTNSERKFLDFLCVQTALMPSAAVTYVFELKCTSLTISSRVLHISEVSNFPRMQSEINS